MAHASATKVSPARPAASTYPCVLKSGTNQVRRQVLVPVAILGHFVRPAIVQRKRPVVRVSQAQVYAPPTGTSLLLKVMLYCYWEHKADTEQS